MPIYPQILRQCCLGQQLWSYTLLVVLGQGLNALSLYTLSSHQNFFTVYSSTVFLIVLFRLCCVQAFVLCWLTVLPFLGLGAWCPWGQWCACAETTSREEKLDVFRPGDTHPKFIWWFSCTKNHFDQTPYRACGEDSFVRAAKKLMTSEKWWQHYI
jgi:hypothetical protein